MFHPPIEQQVAPPHIDGAFLRLLNLHCRPATVRDLFWRDSARAHLVRKRCAQILAADQRALAARQWSHVVTSYRKVLELWVDGTCEGRWVGELDPDTVTIPRLFGLKEVAVTSESYLVISAWPLPPRADDPAWTVKA